MEGRVEKNLQSWRMIQAGTASRALPMTESPLPGTDKLSSGGSALARVVH
jgi:hypothetical protein